MLENPVLNFVCVGIYFYSLYKIKKCKYLVTSYNRTLYAYLLTIFITKLSLYATLFVNSKF